MTLWDVVFFFFVVVLFVFVDVMRERWDEIVLVVELYELDFENDVLDVDLEPCFDDDPVLCTVALLDVCEAKYEDFMEV
jgi:hypothetical protein